MKRMRAVVVATGLALALTGCASEPREEAQAPTPAGADAHAHGHDENSAVVEGAREIAVTGKDLRFQPAELRVRAGEDVTIVFTAADVAHDFTVEGTDVHVGANGGETARGGLRIDEPGDYTYVCTLPGHEEAGMRGTLTVKET